MRWLDGRKLDAVIHLGAISDTTATDGDLVLETNFRLSLMLLDWCTSARTPFLYASSAATYGDGSSGFDDDWTPAALARLRPLISTPSASICSTVPSPTAMPEAHSCRRNGRG